MRPGPTNDTIVATNHWQTGGEPRRVPGNEGAKSRISGVSSCRCVYLESRKKHPFATTSKGRIVREGEFLCLSSIQFSIPPIPRHSVSQRG
mmetsp:Transcript_9952/g.20568  ORF Transcript_9952/g.20568 Transcript_9952/m.20568 type:complete len:91 (-) Transcript_9952:2376-2648(-)